MVTSTLKIIFSWKFGEKKVRKQKKSKRYFLRLKNNNSHQEPALKATGSCRWEVQNLQTIWKDLAFFEPHFQRYSGDSAPGPQDLGLSSHFQDQNVSLAEISKQTAKSETAWCYTQITILA